MFVNKAGYFRVFLAIQLVSVSVCRADTFTNVKTSEVLHGYATGRLEDANTIVHTLQKGDVGLNLADWEVTADSKGRNNKVIVLVLDRMIMYEIETAALEAALARAAAEGPLFILLELDTPGGRVDLAQRICAAIDPDLSGGKCRTVCFITGGKYGGAISAGAAVALACDNNFMAQNAVIGGAAMITLSPEDGPSDIKTAFGEEVGEKLSSIWQANLASLADKHGRPALLARAMVDRNIEVIEVIDRQKRLFIEPVNKTGGQKKVKTWTQKGSLLTLTAAEAVDCKIADAIVESRSDLLRRLGAGDAEIIVDNAIQLAGRELSRAELRVKRLRAKIDLDVKQLGRPLRRARGMSLVKRIRGSLRQLMTLARQYPDLQLDAEALEREYNSVEAFYQQHKRMPAR